MKLYVGLDRQDAEDALRTGQLGTVVSTEGRGVYATPDIDLADYFASVPRRVKGVVLEVDADPGHVLSVPPVRPSEAREIGGRLYLLNKDYRRLRNPTVQRTEWDEINAEAVTQVNGHIPLAGEMIDEDLMRETAELLTEIAESRGYDSFEFPRNGGDFSWFVIFDPARVHPIRILSDEEVEALLPPEEYCKFPHTFSR